MRAVAVRFAFAVPHHRDGHLAYVITYNAAVSASEKGGRWQLSLHVLCSAIDMAISPDIITGSAADSACERARSWRLAHLLRCRQRL